ncbi:anthranilate synthase component I family protein [Paenibacillus silvae]|uniref:anthranilate synthase component I family protein n=2 Tax=Paenibacillus silvae TaxID=1325358 RepID=UPI0011A25722|nr:MULTISPECIES: anthranilate synthase component I family protein [Paenibacillus]MCK6078716.1 anthranilate synthase component I family protein [Paenibacillus silvae]MCK6153035.1 anthranilate synthase component I family protein [Paenibacillus silvae]MCK6271545.1 anthranilate synthase component I family protein [Paenibacillus silvae]
MTHQMTTYADWEAWAAQGWTMLPYITRSDEGPYHGGLPLTWEAAWQYASPDAIVLENGKGGRYTFLGLNPVSIVSGKGLEATIVDVSQGITRTDRGKPLDVLKRWMAPYRAPRVNGAPDFAGGCAGYLSYDVARSLEKLPTLAEDQPALPDYWWMRFEEVWAYDHEQQALFCMVHLELNPEQQEHTDLRSLYAAAERRAAAMQQRWLHILGFAQAEEQQQALELRHRQVHLALRPEESEQETEGWHTTFPQKDFEQAVHKVQEYIRQGDVFQVNLSLRHEKKLQSSGEHIYEWLRIVNPSPYMGMLRSPDFQLVSGSPELLVKVENGKVSARPIAGTRRRGRDAAEDQAMADELLRSEKERAEHIMLVDLERNDIGRIAAYGTVHVPELMTIEKYSHVMHLVSQVEGRLAEGLSVYDVIAATFPGGTITGAPKIRTMEIIEELEPVRRGPYTGSIGWIDYSGNMELNIIIRTLAIKDGTGYVQAGAGIVIDSDPYREYRECRNKARAMMRAVNYSERAEAESEVKAKTKEQRDQEQFQRN